MSSGLFLSEGSLACLQTAVFSLCPMGFTDRVYVLISPPNLHQAYRMVEVLFAQFCPTLCNPIVCPWDSPGKNIGVGSHFLLQRIFPTQGLKPGHLHSRHFLHHLSYQGSPYWIGTHLNFNLITLLKMPPLNIVMY